MVLILTLRWLVVVSFSFKHEGWSLSYTMVSAPLQKRMSFPLGLRTGDHTHTHIEVRTAFIIMLSAV
jgi:hypothetical protein